MRFGPGFRAAAAVLGLTLEDAQDKEKVKKAGRKLSRRFHPDMAGDSPEAAHQFVVVREAWEFLVDDEAVRLDSTRPLYEEQHGDADPDSSYEPEAEVYVGMRFDLMLLHIGEGELPLDVLASSKACLEKDGEHYRVGIYLSQSWDGPADRVSVGLGLDGHLVQIYDGVPILSRSYDGGQNLSALWFSPVT